MKSTICPFWLLLPLLALVSCERKDVVGAPPAEAPPPSRDTPAPAPKMVRDDGVFELISVIEGIQPNRRFQASLNLIDKQRELLHQAKSNLKQNQEDPERLDAVEKLNDLLQSNIAQMVETYGYSPNHNYILVPLEADLYEIMSGKAERVRVSEIRSPAGYDRLQALRSSYEATAREEASNSKPSVKELAEQLQKEFSFNVGSDYNLEIRKGALYRKLEHLNPSPSLGKSDSR